MPHFDHSYAALGGAFTSPQPPTPVRSPSWLAFNHALADTLDWPDDWRDNDAALSALAGNSLLPGSAPVATVYAGHQFGSYNPRLGDGRAILLGEWVDTHQQRRDIQLKGAGTTPYSRGGDGRSPVGPVVREYLVSEAMFALGVPTTRALAAVATGEPVYRQQPEPGAVITRVASSHLRIGTVQYFAMTQDGEGLAELVDYVVSRHYAEPLAAARESNPEISAAQVLLSQYTPRLAQLVAHWQVLGFVHGVLNTDNMLLCAETVDYGPCAFMDHFDPSARFSSIDTQGRYAWPNQPHIAHWNLSVLAQCLLPLLDDSPDKALALAQAEVDRFPGLYQSAHNVRLAAKFGLDSLAEGDRELVDGFYQQLATHRLDLTLGFRWLADQANHSLDASPLPELFHPPQSLVDWCESWQARRAQNTGDAAALTAAMRSANPCVLPRNHQIAAAIAAAEAGDSEHLHTLNTRWQQPFEWQSRDITLARPPEDEERVLRTFCGT